MERSQSLTFLRRGCLLWLVVVLLVAISALGQAVSDPWLILASGEKGLINAHTTRGDLVRAYGASNVVDRDGEGETEAGTVVFPQDPQRSIEILWKDPEKKAEPSCLTISGKTSRWHAVHGISLGMSLSELERLNGRPFHLAGFAWDYSGTVLSWDRGSLAAELDGGHGRLIVRLDPPYDDRVPGAEQSQAMGDRDFTSDHPVMQKLNPKTYQIIWVFPSPTN
jgi:hypothetical protein